MLLLSSMRNAALLFLALTAFGRPAAAQFAASTIDEHMMEFAVAWSTDNEAAVQSLMTEDVVLLGREPLVGVENVMGWARQQMARSGTLVLWPVHSEQHGDTAFQMGRWKLGASSGVHTFLWQQQDDGTWRLASIYILDSSSE